MFREGKLTTRGFICSTQIEQKDFFVILLPIYFGSFNYDSSPYEYVISGNKGVVHGGRPVGTGWIGKQFLGAVHTVTTLMSDQLGIRMEKEESKAVN